jgi:DNA gyrase/topoisomerase IV subunit A
MTDRTGLGIVELAVLETLDRTGAHADRPYMRCARTVADLDASYGLRPDFGYEALCDMARPWMVPLRCVQFHGNFGSLDFPAASPRYTEARLSETGMLAIASERGELGPLPIGLINGNTYCDGSRPPFDPSRITSSLRALLTDPGLSDHNLTDMVGPPVFPTGCDVSGDIGALMAGESITLRLSARLRPADPPRRGWLVDHLPHGVGSREISERVAELVQRRPWSADLPELDRRTRLPVSQLDDLSSGTQTRLLFTAAEGADLDALGRQLLNLQGITIKLSVQLPEPLPDMLRRWITTHRTDDLNTSLASLEGLIDRHADGR